MRVTRHNILVWSIDLTQHLFRSDLTQLIIQLGFSKNESIHLVIQVIMKTVIRFDA